MFFSKKLAVAAVAVVSVLSLSGCIRMETSVTVDSQAQISEVGVLMAVKKDMAGAMGGGGEALTAESFKQQMLASGGSDTAAIEDACSFSESDTEVIMDCAFAANDPAFAQLAEGTGGSIDGLTFTLNGGNIDMVLTGLNSDGLSELTGGMGATGLTGDSGMGSDPAAAAAMAAQMGLEMKYIIHFPGAVSAVSGAGASIDPNDPNTVVVNLLAIDGGDITATASAGSGGLPSAALIAGGVLILLVIGGVVFMMTRKSGKSSGSVSGSAGPSAAASAGYGAGMGAASGMPTPSAAPADMSGGDFFGGPIPGSDPVTPAATGADASPASQQAAPQYSEDGKWWWDGEKWNPVS